MGFAELVIGPAGGGTRWLNPSYALRSNAYSSLPVESHRIIDQQRLLLRRARCDLRNPIDQHAVVGGFLLHVRMRPVSPPDHPVAKMLDERATERHDVVIR